MQFPKITVVVNKIKKKHSVSCCCSKVAAMWCIRLARGWHFNICLLSGEQQQRRTLLILISASVTLLRGGGNIYIKLREWTQADCRCLCLLPLPREVKLLVKLFHFPYFLSLCLHLSYRDTDDPEVSLQLQCQLHWPPHLSVHALTTEDGAGTPEPPAG